MWRMPEGGNAPLEGVAELRSGESPPRAFEWHPSEAECGVSVHDGGLQQWKIANGGAEVGHVLAAWHCASWMLSAPSLDLLCRVVHEHGVTDVRRLSARATGGRGVA